MIDFTNAIEEFNTYKGSEKKKTLIYNKTPRNIFSGEFYYFIISKKSSSVRITIPNSFAFFSLEPAFSPTTT